MHRPPHEKPRFSLPETALVIIVGAALLAGVYAMVHMLNRNDHADEALSLLAAIEQNPAKAEEIAPTDPWGQDIMVVRGEENYSVTFAAVPQGACKHIAKHFDRTNPAFVSISINDMPFREGGEEMNARTISESCTKKENALMIWTFSAHVAT